MDVNNLILQGGALGVVLFAFIFVLKWMIGSFTTALTRIEQAQHANTLALITLSRVQLHANFMLSTLDDKDSKGQQAIAMYQDVMTQLDQVTFALNNLGGR